MPPKSFLLTSRVKPRTLSVYDRALFSFISYCEHNGLTSFHSLDQLDDILTEYVHDQYLSHGSRSSVSYVYCALLLHFPRLRGHLQCSAAALLGWHRLRPPSPFPPLPYDIAVLIAVQMSRFAGLRMGIAVLLSFECLLRVGEWPQLLPSDVVDAGDARVSSSYRGCAIRLANTKTGRNQFVTVLDPRVRLLLRALVASTPPGRPLFPFSASSFRSIFRAAVDSLGLPRFVPHSLRHGGATRLALSGWSVENIAQRGRWASTTSARHYIQSGRALLLTLSIPSHIASVAALLAVDPLLSLRLSLPQQH